MLEKVVYFSGIHGSGKSTLIKDLSKDNPFLVYENIDTNYHLEDTYHRAILRLAKYWVDVQRMEDQSKKNPDKIILVSRCIYDNLAYIDGFFKIGWISETDLIHHKDVFKATFRKYELPRNIVNLCPPDTWAIEMIKKRWQTHPKKWREDKFEYLEAVSQAFRELYSQLNNSNILFLEETDREKRVEVVLDWMRNLNLLNFNPLHHITST